MLRRNEVYTNITDRGNEELKCKIVNQCGSEGVKCTILYSVRVSRRSEVYEPVRYHRGNEELKCKILNQCGKKE